MRLFEAIITANHKAAAGDDSAGLRPADHMDSLPIVALTCIDPRLNPLMPEVLGIPEDQFIWLRNAGNIITNPISSTMRSMALACAVKGGKEIAIIGHTDCQISKTTAFDVIERLQQMGVKRELLPDNINEFFGMFGSERANVIKAVGLVRTSPLIGSKIPVHGLLVDISSGRLEWIVNGYENLAQNAMRLADQLGVPVTDMFKNLPNFNLGDLKLPDIKIGDLASRIQDFIHPEQPAQPQQPPKPAAQQPQRPQAPPPPAPHPQAPPKIPLPTPAKPKLTFKRAPK